MWQWFQNLFDKAPEATPGSSFNSAKVGSKAVDLILEFEGVDQPWARPPGLSGVTIGYGYDLGFSTREEFSKAWSRHLPLPDFSLLAGALGKKGSVAEAYSLKLRNVKPITKVQAREVFDRCTLPKYSKQAAQTFPGLEIFNANQQGVLVSLVFNRGTDLTGDRRTEMMNIHKIIKSNSSLEDKVKKVANQFILMQRVWPSNDPQSGHPGLRRRRRAEGKLFLEG